MSVLATEEMSAVETGQMSSVETGQMSAVDARQMSSAGTRQMSTGKTGRCHVSILYICLVSTADIYLISAADICPVSTADIRPVSTEDMCSVSTADIPSVSTHNVQVSDGQSGPKSMKTARNGSRTVARPRESTQMNPTAISERLGPVPRPKTHQKRAETVNLPVPGRGPQVRLHRTCLGSRAGVMANSCSSAERWRLLL